MTTTSTMQGLGSDEKPTSRVLRPPGGVSSDIFGTGGGAPAPSNQGRRQNAASSNIFGTDEPAKTNTNLPPELVASAEDHKIYGKGRNQSRGRFNPITGEPYDENGSPAAGTPEAKPTRQEQRQQQTQSASPIVGAAPSETGGQGDGSLQAGEGKARPEVHTSSRVTNPPGGRTTKLW